MDTNISVNTGHSLPDSIAVQEPGAVHVVRGAGCRVQGAGCGVRGAGCRVQGAGCGVRGAGSPRGSRHLQGRPRRWARAPLRRTP